MSIPEGELARQRLYQVILFWVFLLIFVTTNLITLVAVASYLYRAIFKDMNLTFPPILRDLIYASVIEVGLCVFALYKKLFELPQTVSANNRQDEQQ